ncbi:hypothetical protein [Sphingobium bisphenolivorans]|uniref:hypothetical protein n=1 Tax=Sphingobium bisphenolivorans TaxID=1335760 RepID=UPI0003A5B35B|nr:hypothetical protein [Sphingobium bisphenolivorans]
MTPAPPRLSLNGEHGFPSDDRISAVVKVSVDGDLLRSVIAYDVIDGWVDVIAIDDAGKPLSHAQQWVTRRVHGDVRAVLP